MRTDNGKVEFEKMLTVDSVGQILSKEHLPFISIPRRSYIPERGLVSYLNKGWELMQIYLKGHRAVIKPPHNFKEFRAYLWSRKLV